MKVSVLTLGCKTNLSESDLFKSAVIEAGHKLASLEEQPDICIINTCTVTAKADYQCRQLIRKALRKGAKRVIVTGCYAQHTPETIRKISPQIEVIPSDKKDNIINMLSDNTSSSLINIPRARPFVKIQEGCDFRCSYCIVWKVRGRSRSVPQKEIIERVKALEERGYLEVVLTGTHIGLYGKDISPEVSLYGLLVNLLKNTKKIRFR
ncbi:MAG: radical SAM protein, partial [Nitrospirae bacterium]